MLEEREEERRIRIEFEELLAGGVTGLSTAVFLGWHGIRALLVERHPDLT